MVVDLPHLVGQVSAVRIGIKICEIAIEWGVVRSATPGLTNLSCQNRNKNREISVLLGVDLPPLVGQIWAVRIGIKICEIAILWVGVDLPHLVCQIWAVRIGINMCEIAIVLGGGTSATSGFAKYELSE